MLDRITVARCNLGFYAENIAKIIAIIPDSVRVMAVVKANAYGHGIEQIAKVAVEAGARYLGVVSIGELRKLRNAGIKAPILLINYLDAASVPEAITLGAAITVMDESLVPVIEAAAYAQSKVVAIHIKLDTGMHRAGCDPSQLVAIAKMVEHSPSLRLEGLFTHFAESESTDHTFTLEQLAVFNSAIRTLA